MPEDHTVLSRQKEKDKDLDVTGNDHLIVSQGVALAYLERETKMKTNICAKCGKPYLKTDSHKRFFLDGYRADTDLCAGCNAVSWVVSRLDEGADISIDDCKKLPKTLIFDPKGNNIQEALRGKQFKELIDRLMEKEPR